jgi:hypothetical protein
MLIWRPPRVDTVRLSGFTNVKTMKRIIQSWADDNRIRMDFCEDGGDSAVIRVKMDSEKGNGQ